MINEMPKVLPTGHLQQKSIGVNLLSTVELAKMLRVSVRTLETLIAEGGAPPFVIVGRSRRWKLDHVEKWIENNTTYPPGWVHFAK